MFNRFAACLVIGVLSACGQGPLKEEPIALPEILPNAATLDIQWWHLLAEDRAKTDLVELQPTVVDDDVYVPLASGEIFKIGITEKAELVASFEQGISAPLSFHDDRIAILTREGHLILTESDFTPIWETPLNGLSVSGAVFDEDRLFVQTIDGRINAIERTTGRLLWAYQDAEPDLTIRGTSRPVLVSTTLGDAVVTGLANGKVVAISVLDGSKLWEYRIAKAQGKTDVSKLVDVDAQVSVFGNQVVATGYQGDLVVINAQTGRVQKAVPFSSYRSIAEGDEYWFGVNAQSHVVALNPVTLANVWVNTDFEYRLVSEIALLDDFVVVADAKGFVHALDRKTGQWQGSRHVDWRGSQSNPVIYKDGVVFQGTSSRVKYLQISQNEER